MTALPPSCTPPFGGRVPSPFGIQPSPFPSSISGCPECFPSGQSQNYVVGGIVTWATSVGSSLGGSPATADASGNIKACSYTITCNPTAGILVESSSGAISSIPYGTVNGSFFGILGGIPGWYTPTDVYTLTGTAGQILVNGGLGPVSGPVTLSLAAGVAAGTLAGTANQVLINGGTAAVSVSGALIASLPASVVGVNSLESALTQNLVLGTASYGAALTITSATGVAAFAAALSAASLQNTPIGSVTVSTGAFSTISATGQFTSTVTTGTAPLVIASTTQVANLNSSQLIGGTWAIPGSIGATTPNAGSFTSLTSSGNTTFSQLNAVGVVINSAAGLLSTSVGGNGTYLGISGGVVTWGTPTATAGGSNTQVQYNNSTALAGCALTTNGTTLGLGTAAVGTVTFLNEGALTYNSNTQSYGGEVIQTALTTGGHTALNFTSLQLSTPTTAGGGSYTEVLGLYIQNGITASYNQGIQVASQTAGSTGNADIQFGSTSNVSGNWGLYQGDTYANLLGGVLQHANGTASLPSSVFSGATTTGLYWANPGVGVSVAASNVGTFLASGLNSCAIGAGTASTGAFTTLSASTSITASGSATLSVGGTSTLTGNVGIGGSPNSSYALNIVSSITGGSSIGIVNIPTLTASGNSQAFYGSYWAPIFATTNSSYTGLVAYGSILVTPTVSGTSGLATSYQLYIQAAATATTRYGIYQSGTDANLLSGNTTMGAGGTSATATFTINGGSGSNIGPYISFQRNGSPIGFLGSFAAIQGGSSANNDLLIQAGSGNAIDFWTNTTQALVLDSSQGATFAAKIVSTSPTGGVGYATGAGGTVSQATSKATAVTLNKITGQITMQGAALGSLAWVSFVVNNTSCAATDIPRVCVVSGGTANAYQATVTAVAANQFNISVQNITGGSLSESPVIGFVIIKGATS